MTVLEVGPTAAGAAAAAAWDVGPAVGAVAEGPAVAVITRAWGRAADRVEGPAPLAELEDPAAAEGPAAAELRHAD